MDNTVVNILAPKSLRLLVNIPIGPIAGGRVARSDGMCINILK